MGSSSYGTLLICLQPSSSPLQTHTPGCQVAESMPFSSNKLPEILNRFSLKEKSAEAEIIKKELEACEEPAMEGEARYCAASLESLIHFSISKLGRNVNVLTSFVSIIRLSGNILSFRLFDLTLKYFIPNTPFGTAIF